MKTHKPNSLWTLLNNTIRERGQISYGDLCQIVAEEGYKVETATRRLRASESPNVEAIRANSKRNTEYIAGYKWVGEGGAGYTITKVELINEPLAGIEFKVKEGLDGLFTYRVHQPITRFNDPS